MSDAGSLLDGSGNHHVDDPATNDTVMLDGDQGGTFAGGVPDDPPAHTQDDEELHDGDEESEHDLPEDHDEHTQSDEQVHDDLHEDSMFDTTAEHAHEDKEDHQNDHVEDDLPRDDTQNTQNDGEVREDVLFDGSLSEDTTQYAQGSVEHEQGNLSERAPSNGSVHQTQGDIEAAEDISLPDASPYMELRPAQDDGEEGQNTLDEDIHPNGSIQHNHYDSETRDDVSIDYDFHGNESLVNPQEIESHDHDGMDEDGLGLEREYDEESVQDEHDRETTQHDEGVDTIVESIEHRYDTGEDKPFPGMVAGSTEDLDGHTQLSHDNHHQNSEDAAADTFQESQVITDSSSLFVPEDGDRSPSQVDPPSVSITMPPPARPFSARENGSLGPQYQVGARQSATPFRQSATPFRASVTPSRPTRDLFSQVRKAQNRFKEKKAATENMSASAPSFLSSAASIGKSTDDQVDREDKEAAEEYRRKEKYYEDIKAKNGGKLSFRHEVEWLKINNNEESRREKRKRDLLLEQEEEDEKMELFPEVTYDTRPAHEPEEGFGNTFDFTAPGSRKRRRTAQPDEPFEQLSTQETEYQSMMVALEAEGDSSGKRRNGGGIMSEYSGIKPSGGSSRRGKGAKPKSKQAKTKKTSSQKGEKGGRLTAKEKRAAAAARTQIGSLLNSNVFEQQASEDAAEQPSFQSTIKRDALKEIIAGLSNQKEAKQDQNALNAATRDFNGRGSVKAYNGMWKVKGMPTTLKGYQLLGSAWMRRKENAVEEPRGGLLADQMGLGKTLMMLANIVNGRPPKSDPGPKTTLLVAGPALLDQWAAEIKKHTDCNLAVMRYSSGNRVDSNRTGLIIDGHDIVLTTWDQVRRSYPKFDPPEECKTQEEKYEWWVKQHKEHRGELHRVKFLRVVLDEAQMIKNHKSQTSLACRGLTAKHRWAISGTPILNGLFELYPYFKFIGVPHTGDFDDFEKNYCDPRNGVDRLLIRLSQFMLRRTHADKMFGIPILKLPRANQSIYWGEFNPVERLVYDIVLARFRQKLGMIVQVKDSDDEDKEPGNRRNQVRNANKQADKKKKKERCYNNIFVLFLRLRQMCSHILMLQFAMQDLLELEDIRKIERVVNNEAANPETSSGRTIFAIRRQLDDLNKKRAAKVVEINEGDSDNDSSSEDDAAETEIDDSNIPAQSTKERKRSGRDFGKQFDFKPFVQSLKKGPEHKIRVQNNLCSYCGGPVKQPWLMSCDHSICMEPCLEDSNMEAAENGKAHSACKTCGLTPTFVHPEGEEPQEDEFTDHVSHGTRSKKKIAQRKRIERQEFPKDWLDTIDDTLLPSAKTIAIKSQILNWIKENKDVKIIVFTQFLAMVQIMGRVCEKEKWDYEEYTGKMSFAARHKALARFADKKDTRILLASIRCGGLGLNLTMAQRVIIVDPWWNEGAEQQAFCRVFRIGQTEKTYLSRICIRKSIDERLIEMQEQKTREINQVMEKTDRNSNLSVGDIMRLFGHSNEETKGRPFRLPDALEPEDGVVYPE